MANKKLEETNALLNLKSKMQKSKLQLKTLRWIGIILVFIILIGMRDTVYSIINFLNKNSGAIQAISTTFLVGVTIFYALETRKYRKILEKEMQRLKIVEICRDLFSLDQQLNLEKENLQKKKYDWDKSIKEAKKLIKLKTFLPPIKFNNISKKFPQIKEKIESHDKKVLEIEEKLRKIEGIILSKGFEEKCKKLIDEFNKKYRKEIETPQFPVYKCEYYNIPSFLKHVIDNDKEVENTEFYYQFWKENGSELLKIREDEEVKKEMDNLYKISNELKNISDELRSKIQEQIDRYQDEFFITYEEIRTK